MKFFCPNIFVPLIKNNIKINNKYEKIKILKTFSILNCINNRKRNTNIFLRKEQVLEEDKYLYNNFLKGDMDSFKGLILKYKNNLIYFLLKYVKDMQIAEDISQDVFIYILVNKKKYNFKYSFKTYLFLIGKSRALNYLKREKKKLEIIENMEIYVEPSLENYIFKNESSERLLEELKKLKPEYRDVIYLTNFERLSYREAGKILGKNEKQVKTLLYNAKQTLKNNLERKGFRYEE